MEYKAFIEHREIDEGERIVTGFPSIFGNVDDGGDLIQSGAYTKTIAERRQRFKWLWRHDATQPPIATILDVREVGKSELPDEVRQRHAEATGGLMVKRKYLDTPRGNEVWQGILEKAVTEMSIGYDPIQAEPPKTLMEIGGRKVRRVLKEIRLWEMSDVLWGMNEATTNLKTIPIEGLIVEELAEQLDALGVLDELRGLLKARDMLTAEQMELRQRRLNALSRQLALS